MTRAYARPRVWLQGPSLQVDIVRRTHDSVPSIGAGANATPDADVLRNAGASEPVRRRVHPDALIPVPTTTGITRRFRLHCHRVPDERRGSEVGHSGTCGLESLLAQLSQKASVPLVLIAE